MSESCNGWCESCDELCDERKPVKEDFLVKANDLSSFKHIIGVVSGKGGVGKSSVTAMLAVEMRRKGYRTGVLDADITGPSIPKAYGIHEKAYGTDFGLMPVETVTGISVMSINLLLEKETDPVIWRGPVLANTVKQFFTDVIWGDLDYLFVDLPPGTGDVPLTVFQSLPLDGIIIVTSPQELVSMVVTKAVKMAEKLNVRIYGLVENFTAFLCPDNGIIYKIFGDSHVDDTALNNGLNVLGKIFIDPALAKACDEGHVEKHISQEFTDITDQLELIV